MWFGAMKIHWTENWIDDDDDDDNWDWLQQLRDPLG